VVLFLPLEGWPSVSFSARPIIFLLQALIDVNALEEVAVVFVDLARVLTFSF